MSNKTNKKVDFKSLPKPPKAPNLTSSIFDYFDNFENLDEIVYEKVLKLSKQIKSNTKFNKNHFSYYKNRYNILCYNNLRPKSKIKFNK